MPARKSMEGKRFGKLLVLRRYDITKNQKWRWLCLCDCGKEVPVIGNDLSCNKRISCGCLRPETAKKNGIKHAKHHLCFTPTYITWKGIRAR